MFFQKLLNTKARLLGLILLIPLVMGACANLPAEQAITDADWQWSEMVETEPASQSRVADPGSYTLRLASDGSLGIRADCNVVGGSYQLEGSALTIELGPSTLAFCGEESLDTQFLGFLSQVESYAIENGELILSLKDGAGQMTFRQG